MIKKSFVFLTVVIMLSCQQHDAITTELASSTPDLEVRDGRLVFTSVEHYADMLSQLDRLHPNERSAWTAKYKFNSLENFLNGVQNRDLFIEENKMQNMGPSHFLVLNEDRLLQIGKDVIYFDEHTKYFMDIDEYDGLSDKSDILKSERTAEFLGFVAGENDRENAGRTQDSYWDAYNKGDNGIGAGGFQHQFWVNGVQKKFVDEWWVNTENLGGGGCSNDVQIRSTIYLRLKFQEYRKYNCCQWRWEAATDPRTLNWDVSIWNAYFQYGAHPSWAGCGYRDLEMGPYSGGSVYGDVVVSSTQYLPFNATNPFWGEWHATYDLKKWYGRAGGVVNHTFNQTGYSMPSNF